MQRRDRRANPRQIARRYNLRRWAAMSTDTDPEPALLRENPLRQGASRSSPATADAALAFGRFRVLLRQRQLLADGIPVELGRRAFDPRNGSARDPQPYRRRGYRQSPRRGRRLGPEQREASPCFAEWSSSVLT
jgi:hypothetical protein